MENAELRPLERLEATHASRTSFHNANYARQLFNDTELFNTAATIIQDFIRTGIAFYDATFAERIEQVIDGTFAGMIREEAKARGRTAIIATSHNNNRYVPGTGWVQSKHIQLAIPKRTRLKPLAAPLLIAAEEIKDNQMFVHVDVAIARSDTGGMWNFFFREPDGAEIFHKFRETAHADPVLRAILNL